MVGGLRTLASVSLSVRAEEGHCLPFGTPEQEVTREEDRAGLKPPPLGGNVLPLSTWDVGTPCPLEHQDSLNSDYTNSSI